MSSVSRRIAFLTGASIAALSFAFPAQADTVPGIGDQQTGSDVAGTLTISNIGDVFEFGVDNSSNAAVTSVVDSVATGQILQNYDANGPAPAGVAIGTLNNDGSVQISAIADSLSPGGAANATVVDAIQVIGNGEVSAEMTLDNDGLLGILASASVNADADAFANASMQLGALVSSNGVSQSTATLDNSGEIHAGAVADAWGDLNANADAQAGTLVSSHSTAGDNVAQSNIHNSGLIEGGATATATAVAGNAIANADVLVGLNNYAQVADTGSGEAITDITNSDTVDILASANADAGANAVAAATLIYAVYQQVNGAGGPGRATLTNENSGLIDVDALAFANGATSTAIADLGDDGGLLQDVEASTSGSTDIINDGDIMLSALADAFATDGMAGASAHGIGVHQDLEGDSSAIASIVSSGTIDIGATADATGTSAAADAKVDYGINQDIQVMVAGNSSAALESSGIIKILADAEAHGQTDEVVVNATIASGIVQDVTTPDGISSASITNSGSLDLDAKAVSGGELATANASIDLGISQAGDAAIGSANMGFNNSVGGKVHIKAFANATGSVEALANANLNELPAFNQAGSGDIVAANFTNDGSFEILAEAVAAADTAAANAAIALGAIQSGEGGNVTLTAVNSGNFSVGVTADADGPDAAGSAFGSGAFLQLSEGTGTVKLSLTNSDTMSMKVDADAAGDGLAEAISTQERPAITQHVKDAATAELTLTNEASGSIDVDGIATVSASDANAVVNVAGGILQWLEPSPALGPSSILLGNAGTIDVAGDVDAIGGTAASAFLFVANGIRQNAIGSAGASVTFRNGGNVRVGAAANGLADNGFASASAIISNGIVQQALNATAMLENGGTIQVNSVAAANGLSIMSPAALVAGALQDVRGANAVANFLNKGEMKVGATSTGEGGIAIVTATAHHGIIQDIDQAADATASAINDGDLLVSATANGIADMGNATVVAQGGLAIMQEATSTSRATLGIDNGGTIGLSLIADSASAADARAEALGSPLVSQSSLSAPVAIVSLLNSGTMTAGASAIAVSGTGGADEAADASANAIGAVQSVAGTGVDATMSAVNSGAVTITASATATGDEEADAIVDAIGIAASALAAGASTQKIGFANSGNLGVSGTAIAEAEIAAAASVEARGYNLIVADAGAVLDIDNSGGLNVSAVASAPTSADARATAMDITAIGTGSLSGTIDNSGSITVLASAAGAGTAAGSAAVANGIDILSGPAALVLTNSGSIDVDAIVDGEGTASAVGIRLVSNGAGPAGSELFTLNNSGDLIIRVSQDGGETWKRGMAIDVALAPTASVINLNGGSDIYGNIDTGAADVINVADGTTTLNGIVNPEFVPAGGIVAASLDSGLFGEAAFNVLAGGNLVMLDPRTTGPANMYDGPSYAFVNSYTQDAGGTITFDLQPAAAGAQPVGSYSQIFADTATIDGTLVANITTPGGVLADEYFWDNVIDANTLTGTFDTCSLSGAAANSPLLQLECIYDANDNVDLGLTRIAFNDVPGLTINQTSVAECLECIYEMGVSGKPIANVMEQLFQLDEEEYPEALDQLAGASIASYLQSYNLLGVRYNSLLDRATGCPLIAPRGSVLDCRPEKIRLWGQLDYGNARQDGDAEAPSYDADQWSMTVGLDARVSETAVIGLSLARVTNKANFSRFGANAEGSGYQVGLYGVYDPGPFYVKAIGTYSSFDGDAKRTIDFTNYGPGLTLAGQLEGDPDTRQWTFGLHGGARIKVGDSDTLTPYLNLDYVDTKLKGYTETGLAGANLHVRGGDESRFYSTLGTKYATHVGGGAILEADLGWRHMFGDKRASFNAAFEGWDDCDFDIISAREKRDSALFGLSLGGNVAGVNVRAGYQGLYNGDATTHSATFKLSIPLK